jgi:hypothetical protein
VGFLFSAENTFFGQSEYFLGVGSGPFSSILVSCLPLTYDMKASPHTTIISTPLANCWLENGLVYIDNVSCNRTPVTVNQHYDILFPVVGEKRVCWLKKFPACDVFDQSARKVTAERLPDKCEALALVTSEGGVKNLAASFKELKETGVPVVVFTSVDEAKQWLYKQC